MFDAPDKYIGQELT